MFAHVHMDSPAQVTTPNFVMSIFINLSANWVPIWAKKLAVKFNISDLSKFMCGILLQNKKQYFYGFIGSQICTKSSKKTSSW